MAEYTYKDIHGYCPKCGKPAARKEGVVTGMRYLHFTKKGSVWHTVAQREEGRDG